MAFGLPGPIAGVMTQLNLFRAIAQSSLIITAGNACAYLTQVILARNLSPAEFGAANAILALSLALVAPLAVTPMVVARMLLTHADQPAIQAGLVRQVFAASTGLSLLIWIAHLPFGDALSDGLRVSPFMAYVLLPAVVATTFLHMPFIGYWQGMGQYGLMALTTAGVPVLRCLAAAVLVALLGWGLDGAIWALILSGAAVIAWGAAAVFRAHPSPAAPPRSTWVSALRFAAPSSLAMLGLIGLGYIDQPIVRAIAPEAASGQYAAASTLAKIALLLPVAVSSVLFPEVARLSSAAGSEERATGARLLVVSLAATAGISGAAAFAMIMVPELCLTILFGASYADAAAILQMLAPAMTLLAVSNVLVTFALAQGRFGLIGALLLALSAATAVPFAFNLEPIGVAALMLSIMGVLCGTCLVWVRISTKAPNHSD